MANEFQDLMVRLTSLHNQACVEQPKQSTTYFQIQDTIKEILRYNISNTNHYKEILRIAYWGCGLVVEVSWIAHAFDLSGEQVAIHAGSRWVESKCCRCSVPVQIRFLNRTQMIRESQDPHYCPKCLEMCYRIRVGSKL